MVRVEKVPNRLINEGGEMPKLFGFVPVVFVAELPGTTDPIFGGVFSMAEVIAETAEETIARLVEFNRRLLAENDRLRGLGLTLLRGLLSDSFYNEEDAKAEFERRKKEWERCLNP